MTDIEYRNHRSMWLRWAKGAKRCGDIPTLRWCRKRMVKLRKQYYIRTCDILAKIERIRSRA